VASLSLEKMRVASVPTSFLLLGKKNQSSHFYKKGKKVASPSIRKDARTSHSHLFYLKRDWQNSIPLLPSKKSNRTA